MREEAAYSVDLRHLPTQGVERVFTLDDTFFESVADAEPLHGALTAHVQASHGSKGVACLRISIHGTVRVACDRCLEFMDWPVQTEQTVAATLRCADVESSDVLLADERTGCVDLTWTLYEQVRLAIPQRHTHARGQCDPEMSALLSLYIREEEAEPNT